MMLLKNADLLLRRRVADFDLQQEAVKLRFRQRICAFKLDWILRGKDGKELRERMRNAVNGDLALFHGFQHCGLRTRRHAVDLVGEQEIGEERPAMQREGA